MALLFLDGELPPMPKEGQVVTQNCQVLGGAGKALLTA
jgi:hypothetical protein